MRHDSHVQDTEQSSNRSERHIVVGNAHLLELLILRSRCGPTTVAVSLCRSAPITTVRALTGRLIVAAAEQHNVFGNNLGDIHLSALFVVIAARLQPAFDVY